MNAGPFHHDRFDQADLDRPRRATPPATRMVVASTPRSGSYLLCRQLFRAGVGVPTEYLRGRTMHALAKRWHLPPGIETYLEEVERRRTGDNGVFAAKLQRQHLQAHPEALDRWLRRADLVVVLVREDRIAQAVSWQVSLATGYWSADATRGRRDPGVSADDPVLTRHLAVQLERDHRWIDDTCAASGRPTLTLTYERLVEDQPGAIAAIAARLGLGPADYRRPAPESPGATSRPEVDDARGRLLAALRASP